ncbi:MAG: M28 family peptidase [Nonomuraea sp.]|nr:M28 family peptidase [Nonomuraea sp.]
MFTVAMLLLALIAPDARLLDTISVDHVLGHLRAFDSIAGAHGGNRAAGLPGHDASADYVAARLREAGYTVELQPFTFDSFHELGPAVLAGRRAYEGVSTLRFSGSGEVVGRPRRVGDGCEAGDFRGLGRGEVAMSDRGRCTFRAKAENAAKAGAAALVVVDGKKPFRGSLEVPQPIPVVGVGPAVGAKAAGLDRVRVVTRTRNEKATTRNVLAETAAARPGGKVVMVGAHLDSVERGPGINDNGTGSAAALELALLMARARPDHAVRFAWWGAEEVGLIGSRHYVDRLPARERARIEVYLNFDMIGSPNHTYAIYDGDDRAEAAFRGYFAERGLPYHSTPFRGASDYAPFLDAGIPAAGLFTGGQQEKTAAEAKRFGGRAGEPKDPCYHQPCDGLRNVNAETLKAASDAMAYVVARYAWPGT